MISFNFYYDLYFWLYFFGFVVLFRFLSFNQNIRNIFLFIGSITMLLALPRFNIDSLLLLFGISLLTFFTGYILNKGNFIESKAKRLSAAIIMLLLIIVILTFFKYTYLQQQIYNSIYKISMNPADFIFIIGISYSSFKMMHFVVESYKKQINKLAILDFLNYIFFFPAFISGPINRYSHFVEQLNLRGMNNIKSDLRIGSERIIHGLFKKFVLVSIAYPYVIINVQKSIIEMSAFEIVLGLYAYTLYIYFDFAGYSDIAIGSAKILGIELPENFNNPFMKKNIQQLWANWHISFTGWLIDYIYWPLTRKLRNFEFLRKSPIFLSNISIIVTFIVCGIWHGETFNFVVWGFYHGIGLAIFNIYQKQKRRIKNPRVRQYFKSKYSIWIGIFVTFNFFTLGILLFSMQMEDIILLISRFLG